MGYELAELKNILIKAHKNRRKSAGDHGYYHAVDNHFSKLLNESNLAQDLHNYYHAQFEAGFTLRDGEIEQLKKINEDLGKQAVKMQELISKLQKENANEKYDYDKVFEKLTEAKNEISFLKKIINYLTE